ncbi:hypothetical protein Cgig2_005056 [Carnegiea gigantea]|uniref:Uncharacterized protein n=1 Tax=Carnegiea gigantea TaxID=171969 RepID=A0A9Q1KZE2_9CARY|nr:hypothetical protein Cgig2_005056 [Carnegiea gigantea]
MAFSTQYVISDLSDDPFMPKFDEDVIRMELQMDSSRETLVKAKELKEEGNTLYKSKAYRSAINSSISESSGFITHGVKGLSEEAKQDLLVAIQLEPYNEEIRDQLSRVEELCNISCNKVLTKEVQAQIVLDGEQDMKKTLPDFEDKVGGPLRKK